MRMQPKIIFEPHIPMALHHALEYAGDDGFVASLPELLRARTNAPYDNVVWNTWFTANSEECVVTSPQGNSVVVAIHGGGVLGTPERFERSLQPGEFPRPLRRTEVLAFSPSSEAYFHGSLYTDMGHQNPEGLTGDGAAKVTPEEARDVLAGRLPDGTRIPIFAFNELRQGIDALPRRFGVVMDFELARKTVKGFTPFEVLKEEPNFIARAGGVDAAAAYLDRFQARHDTKLMGNFYPFNYVDPDQPQTRVIFLAGNKGGVGSEGDYFYGYDSDYGIGGWGHMVGMARYIAVKPGRGPGPAGGLRGEDFQPEGTRQ